MNQYTQYKDVGSLLCYIERKVRLGHNLACTSKSQIWHIQSKKQQKLHTPSVLEQVPTRTPKIQQMLKDKRYCKNSLKKILILILGQCTTKTLLNAEITLNDLDILTEATNKNCGLVLLMREHNVDAKPDLANFFHNEIVNN